MFCAITRHQIWTILDDMIGRNTPIVLDKHFSKRKSKKRVTTTKLKKNDYYPPSQSGVSSSHQKKEKHTRSYNSMFISTGIIDEATNESWSLLNDIASATVVLDPTVRHS
jgi:hypothetical protein